MVLATLVLALPVHAEPIQITSGALLLLPNQLTLAGPGFTFDGRVGLGVSPVEECRSPVCQAGSIVDLQAFFSGADLPGTATLNGQTYTQVGSLSSNHSLTGSWEGSLTIPADFSGGVLTAPFTFTGTFFFFDGLSQQQQELFGHGTASLTFGPNVPSAFRVTAATYQFESAATPTPEPMSIVLVGTGLAGLTAWRRRVRRRTCGEDV